MTNGHDVEADEAESFAIEYIDLDRILPGAVRPVSAGSATSLDWDDLPPLGDLRMQIEGRGLKITDVDIVTHRDCVRLRAGPFDIAVGSGATIAAQKALDLCLDAVAAAVARKIMMSAAKGWRAETPSWAMTASSILVDACKFSDISEEKLWSAASGSSSGASTGTAPPRGLRRAIAANVELRTMGSRIAFEAKPLSGKSRIIVDDLDGFCVRLGDPYPMELLSRYLGRSPLSTLAPIQFVPLLGKLGMDPIITSAESGGTRIFSPRDSIRLGFEIPTRTLSLAPMAAMKAVGFEHPHLDHAEKPWITAAYTLANIRRR